MMLRRAVLLAVLSLSFAACQNSERFSDSSIYRPDLSMPASPRPATNYGSASLPIVQASYRPETAEWPSRAPDSLPRTYGELSGAARQTGQWLATPADTIVVEKAAHRLTLYRGGSILRSFQVALGNPYGDKVRPRDGRTPEGVFPIVRRRDRGETNYHRALVIGYPDLRGSAEIEIHGSPNGWEEMYGTPPGYDWTIGCMGLTNREMDFVWDHTTDTTRIIIQA